MNTDTKKKISSCCKAPMRYIDEILCCASCGNGCTSIPSQTSDTQQSNEDANYLQVGKMLKCGHCDEKYAEGAKDMERLGVKCNCQCHDVPSLAEGVEEQPLLCRCDRCWQIKVPGRCIGKIENTRTDVKKYLCIECSKETYEIEHQSYQKGREEVLTTLRDREELKRKGHYHPQWNRAKTNTKQEIESLADEYGISLSDSSERV